MNVNGIIIAHSKLETLNYFSDCIKDAAEKDGRLETSVLIVLHVGL